MGFKINFFERKNLSFIYEKTGMYPNPSLVRGPILSLVLEEVWEWEGPEDTKSGKDNGVFSAWREEEF